MNKTVFTSLLIGSLAWGTSLVAAETTSDRISVTVRGKGPDVILIPGLACSNAVWDATAKRLEGSYRVHLVQFAGFAGAPAKANAKGAVVQPTIEAIDAYIKSNKLKSPKVIGHSLGGLGGLMLAERHPEDVGKLMIVDALPFFGVIMGAKDVAAVEPNAATMRDTILKESQEAYAQGEEMFLRTMVKSEENRKTATGWAVASDKAVVASALYDVMTTDLRPKLNGIKTPVTVLYAWDSGTGFPQAMADSVYKDSYEALPNKTLVRMENSYHFIMLDQPEAFAKQVEEFLK